MPPAAKTKTVQLTATGPAPLVDALLQRAQEENFASPGQFVIELFRRMLETEERRRLDQLLSENPRGPSVAVNERFWQDLDSRVSRRVAAGRKASGHRKRR